jgi:hypothetical protein
MKNEQVVEEFLNDGEGKTKNLYFENKNGKMVLYSYGYHFPICIKLKDGYLFNIDGYSSTTSRHKGLLARALNFSNFKELEKVHVKDLMTSSQLNKVIDSDVLTKTEIIANKI